MEKYKNKLIVTTLITLLPVVIGLLFYKDLPGQIPVHFDLAGNPDSFARKYMVIFFLPFFLAVVHVGTILYTLHDPKKKNIGNKMLGITFYLFPIISVIVNTTIFIYALGYKLDITRVVMLFLGFMFIILGNYLTKIHQNYTVGIKLPWTLNSTENWNKTHRMASRLFIACGTLLLINATFKSMTLFFIIVVILIFVPIIYSLVLYKKGI